MDRDAEEAQAALGGDGRALSGALVLLDVDLPGLDGAALLRRMHSNGALREAHVIALTSNGKHAEAIEALGRGAVEQLEKPLEVPVLMQRVRWTLRQAA